MDKNGKQWNSLNTSGPSSMTRDPRLKSLQGLHKHWNWNQFGGTRTSQWSQKWSSYIYGSFSSSCVRVNRGLSQRNYKERWLQWKGDASEDSSTSPTPTTSPLKKSVNHPSTRGSLWSLLTTVKKRKLRWCGHVTRSSGLSKIVLQGTVQGKRRRGRQEEMDRQHWGMDRKRWTDSIEEWTGREGQTALRNGQEEMDRQHWGMDRKRWTDSIDEWTGRDGQTALRNGQGEMDREHWGMDRKRWTDSIEEWTGKTFAETQALQDYRQDWGRLVQCSLEQLPYDPGGLRISKQ